MKKIIYAVFAAVLSCACTAAGPEGAWVQPVPGMQGREQGLLLEKGGKAQSINMATLIYTGWSLNGDTLTLRGKSIGNGQTIDFTQSYAVKTLDAKHLVLQDEDGAELIFTRQK